MQPREAILPVQLGRPCPYCGLFAHLGVNRAGAPIPVGCGHAVSVHRDGDKIEIKFVDSEI
jgi:hypothetical protein